MFGKTVAVEEGLWGGIKEALEKEGYHVVKTGAHNQVDATILTGLDRNVMGMQDITNKSIVLDASGKTAEQILQDLRDLL